MDANVFFRSTMASQFSARKFFKRVASDMTAQLKEWDENFSVEIDTWKTYVLLVKNGSQTYRVAVAKNAIDILQNESPYALDEQLWKALYKQGLRIQRNSGNYIQTVFKQYDKNILREAK